MCFSATASFTASAVLLATGIIAEKKSTTRAQRIFSGIPLIFSIQQFTEGLLWVGYQHPQFDFLVQPAMYTYIIFAQVVWPIMIPLSILLLEPRAKRKILLRVFLILGGIAGTYLLYGILYYGVTSKIECYHIYYRQYMPDLIMKYGGIFYLTSIIIGPFFSSIKKIRWLGVVILISYIISQIFYTEYLASVWCFFAAIISFIILIIINDLNKKAIIDVATANE